MAGGADRRSAGEGKRPDQLDHEHQDQAPLDRHAEVEGAEQEQHSHVGDQEGQAGPEQGQQEVAPGHGGGHEALQKLGDAEVHQQEADAPESPPHRVQSDEAGDQEVNVA